MRRSRHVVALVAPVASVALPVALAALGGAAPGAARADVLGGLDGRSADTGALPRVSAELSWVADEDVSVLGLRANYKLDATKVGFLTAGRTEYDESGAKGYLVGAGLYYHLARQRLSSSTDLALKPSLGHQSAEGDGAEVDGFVVALELLISGRRSGSGRVGWYANLGTEYSYIDTNNRGSDGDVDGLIGAGVHASIGPGQFYIGFDYSGELGVGAGYRLHFTRAQRR